MGSARPRQTYIVVFGAAVRSDGSPSGTLRRRIAAAFALAKTAGPVRFLVTGGTGEHPPAEAVLMRQRLLELGAREDQVLVEDQAENTRRSAALCAALLRAQDDVGQVLVCSSRYHIPRCRMLLRLNGIPSVPGAASEDAAFVGRLRYAYYCLRELVAIPVDLLRAALGL